MVEKKWFETKLFQFNWLKIMPHAGHLNPCLLTVIERTRRITCPRSLQHRVLPLCTTVVLEHRLVCAHCCSIDRAVPFMPDARRAAYDSSVRVRGVVPNHAWACGKKERNIKNFGALYARCHTPWVIRRENQPFRLTSSIFLVHG